MEIVEEILFRELSSADFDNIEHVAAPVGGGGQSFIDLAQVDKQVVRDFFAGGDVTLDPGFSRSTSEGAFPAYDFKLTSLGRQVTDTVSVDVRTESGRLRSYRIKEQRVSQRRHNGWLPENGFPTIIGSQFMHGGQYPAAARRNATNAFIGKLVIYIVRTNTGRFYSGFLVSSTLPSTWPSNAGLEAIRSSDKAGVIRPSVLLELVPSDGESPFLLCGGTEYSDIEFGNEVFIDPVQHQEIQRVLKRRKNLVLQGSPGTGKSFSAKRIAHALIGHTCVNRVLSVQFHQNSTYEDYICGYRPTPSGDFALQLGIFTEFFRRANSYPSSTFYLIIDEINRANVSKVFGEMLFAMEADHRGEETALVASDGEKFSVPVNVFIIGMMNTADRGLALIDYALRRRFAFVALKPGLENSRFEDLVRTQGLVEFEKLIEKVIALNVAIEDDASLGSGFTIGHSYFTFSEQVTVADLQDVVNFEIAPLLEEYWFDQPDLAKMHVEQLLSVLI